MKLVYVHGIAQERKDPKALLAEWNTALRQGLAAAGITWPSGAAEVLPYFGDVFGRQARRGRPR